MGTKSEVNPGEDPQEDFKPEKPQTPSHFFIFHHEGAFADGEGIYKAYSWGKESTLVIDNKCVEELKPTFLLGVKLYDETLPQQEIFSNGLSRQQAVEVCAAQETVLKFNGGFFDEHSSSRNAMLYSEQEGEGVNLSSFNGKEALTCVESAALVQQMLSGSQEMTYVSGAADLHNSGQFEMHSFNLIKPADDKYAAAILDISNPIYFHEKDGDLKVKLYCAPITLEQLEKFKRGDALEVEYAGEKRTYQFKAPQGPILIW